MQSAYGAYKRSSEALECTRRTGDDPTASEQVRLMMLEGQQRLAFERYMEARIAFLESRFDELNRAGAAPGEVDPASDGWGGIEGESNVKAWLSRISGRPVLQTLGVVLLCTMAFSLMRQQIRIRGLEAGRDDLRAALLSTSQEVQQLRQRLDASSLLSPPLSQQTRRSQAGPEPLKPFVVPRPATKKPTPGRKVAQQRSPHQANGASRIQATGTTNHRAGSRPIAAFSLSPSREFKRVGPLRVLLRSINPQKGTASLEIVTEITQVDVQSLRLNEPVWISIARYDHPLGLVAERITRNRIEGHLWEAESARRELRASQSRPKFDSTP